jgi:D-arabinose 1-dehydrogenase-like Zn-dependent alcohol dehydrogenase
VVGIVDDVGVGVTGWNKGQRVGVGWHGGHDGTCLECRRGDFRNCRNRKVPGISYDGGYQQYMVAPVEALGDAGQSRRRGGRAAALRGITTFGALRSCGARPGDLVAVIGVGGLGHLAIQFANKFGYTVAGDRARIRKRDAREKLGATHYIDSTSSNVAAALQQLGGAQAILATAPSSKSMSEAIDGLAPNGRLMVVGADSARHRGHTHTAHYRGRTIQVGLRNTADSEDTLRFAELSGVAADDRNLSARARGGGLRANDERQGTVSASC